MSVLRKQIKELPGNVLVLLVHEGEGVPDVTDTAGTSDTMHVVIDVVGQVVVDHLGHVGDVETAGSHVRRNQHRALA